MLQKGTVVAKLTEEILKDMNHLQELIYFKFNRNV